MPRDRAGQASRPRKSKIQIDVIVRSARWRRRPSAKNVAKKAIVAAAKAVSTRRAELAIVFSDDSAVQALNRKWRGKNMPTNVLSFPAVADRRGAGKAAAPSPYIGDIVIAYGTVAREAKAEGKTFDHHLAHLTVHGFLHLVGYDHDNDRDADTMEGLERRILARIAVPDPYAGT